jgi:hypothetical protein
LIDVADDGEFATEVARFTNELLEFEPGLQLRLSRGEHLARGWIQSELALRSATLSRLAGAVVGLFQNSGVTSDLREFVVEVLKCGATMPARGYTAETDLRRLFMVSGSSLCRN